MIPIINIIPITICQVLGNKYNAYDLTNSKNKDPINGAKTFIVPDSMATNTNSPDFVQ